VVSTSWDAVCIKLVDLYAVKDKDGSVINFMALTMINTASSWFEIVELPLFLKL
jgi:hypothetical protein